MPTDQNFQHQQRAVATGMASAAIIAAITIAAALWLADGVTASIEDRIAFTLKADLFVVIWLFVTIANVARLRFFSPQDIAGSGSTTASDYVRNANAVLENTMEQTVLALPVHLALATILPHPKPLIIALVILFGIGRAFFWRGYAKGAPARAFGFALTFYPTVFSIFVAIACLVAS